MEKLKTYITKRNLYIACLISGVLVIFLISTSSTFTSEIESIGFQNIGSVISSIKSFCNIFYVNLLMLLIITAGYVYRLAYLKDKSLITKIMTGSNGAALLCAIVNYSFIHVVKSALNGNFEPFAGITTNAGITTESKGDIFLIMVILQVVIAIIAGVYCFVKKDTNEGTTPINNENTSEDMPISTNNEPKESMGDRFKAYYATESGKRNVRIGAIVSGVIVVLVIGINIYSSLKRTTIDLTASCEVTFEGVSREGYASVTCNPDYDHTDEKIKTFIQGVTYSVKDNGSLENGKYVEVQANYSEATADSSKVTVKGATKKFKVKGLEVAYLTYKDVPKKLSSQFEEAAKSALTKDIQAKAGDSLFGPKAITLDEMQVIGVYYEYSSYNTSGSAYYVFRTSETLTNTYSIDKEVNYYYVAIENLNSKQDPDLNDDSDDISIHNIYMYKNKTDKEVLDDFLDIHSSAEIIKESPSTDTYNDESTDI